MPLRFLSLLLGALLIGMTLSAAIRTFVLPRGADVWLTRWVFRLIHRIFRLRAGRVHTYAERDHVMAMFAPTALLTLPLAWVMLVLIGFTWVFWGIGVQPVYRAFHASGSALLTLGFASVEGWGQSAVAFTEATLGLGLIALLIAYLPAIYASFAKRETAVAMLEIRAGSPPSAITLLERAHRLGRLPQLGELWASWEYWFTEIEESHTSLMALVFFRSPQSDRSWITAAGAVLDAAALTASTVDLPRDVRADLCIRSGYLALARIADVFHIEYNRDPDPSDPISINRSEFDQALERLAAAGVPLKQDRDQSWVDYSGWRVNYDTALIALAALTMAPYAPWVSDRSLRDRPVRTAIWKE